MCNCHPMLSLAGPQHVFDTYNHENSISLLWPPWECHWQSGRIGAPPPRALCQFLYLCPSVFLPSRHRCATARPPLVPAHPAPHRAVHALLVCISVARPGPHRPVHAHPFSITALPPHPRTKQLLLFRRLPPSPTTRPMFLFPILSYKPQTIHTDKRMHARTHTHMARICVWLEHLLFLAPPPSPPVPPPSFPAIRLACRLEVLSLKHVLL